MRTGQVRLLYQPQYGLRSRNGFEAEGPQIKENESHSYVRVRPLGNEQTPPPDFQDRRHHLQGAPMPSPRACALTVPLFLATLMAATLAGCGGSASISASSSGKLNVVAAENFWGSIARQLGGDQVEVTSIITNPAADPHDYEPTSADARTVAGSQMTIVDGIGYDQWATKLLAANPSSERTVLTVGELLGLKAGDNPHQWYSPSSVRKVIDQITADYKKADPGKS